MLEWRVGGVGGNDSRSVVMLVSELVLRLMFGMELKAVLKLDVDPIQGKDSKSE